MSELREAMEALLEGKRKHSQMYGDYKDAPKVHPTPKDNRMWMNPKHAKSGSMIKSMASQDVQSGEYMPPQEKAARRHYDHAYRLAAGGTVHKKIKARFDAGEVTIR